MVPLIFFLLAKCRAAEWQWSVPVDSVALQNSAEHPRAFLWIPPDCQKVRAVVVGQNNMIEEGILQHAVFRREMARLGIAEIFIAPTFDTWQNLTNNDLANQKFNALLRCLARESGYRELEFAPVIPLGHSAMASYPWNFAAWNPGRTLAILSVHGDAPQTTLVGNGRPNVEWAGRTIDGIPGLMVMGEYEWWEDRLTPAFTFRGAHPAAPIAFLADVGHGHFDYSDDLVRFLAMFIRKAVAARLPASQMTAGPVQLKPVDPAQGWLVERWHPEASRRAKSAPLAEYTGDSGTAFWAFDREMAKATENFNSQCGHAPQLVGFVQDGKIVPQTDTHQQVNLNFAPQNDGVTFHLQACFLDAVPGGSKNPSKWTGLSAGSPLGHATGGGSVKISRISGPVEQLSADTFAVRFNRSSIPADRRMGDIWLLASQPGDAHFKSAVQQALLKIPLKLQDGMEQHITFPEIADVKEGIQKIKLHATSDAGVPVYFYVREGPAEVDGDTLHLTTIPPRAIFPIKVTIVAWQYGRSVEPKLKSAELVVQTFQIVK